MEKDLGCVTELSDGLYLATAALGIVREVGRSSGEALAEVDTKFSALITREEFIPRACIYNPRDY